MGEPGKKWHWHLRELQNSFQSSLQKVSDGYSIWLFVDALDECGKENAVGLIETFRSLLQHARSAGLQFCICVTCRHYPILDQNCEFEICLERENQQDTSTYVKAQFSKSHVLKESSIPALITERANGIFMWARLVVDQAVDLDNGGSEVRKLQDKVESIPLQLDQLYNELVQGMDERLASLKLIQWICFATRPLSLDELR